MKNPINKDSTVTPKVTEINPQYKSIKKQIQYLPKN